MPRTMALSDNHVFMTAAHDLKALTDERLKQHGVSHFAFRRAYDDGRTFIIGNDQQIVRYVFENEVPVAPVDSKLIQDNFNYLILPIGNYKKILSELKNNFNTSHFINVIERHEGYFDLFVFGAHANNPGIINFYLNKMDVVENFNCYFKDKARDLIQVADRNKIQVSDTMSASPFKGLSGRPSSTHFDLTKRQIDCLALLVKGMSYKETGKKLNLSPRTVEHYVDAVKMKLNCDTRSELISKALKMRHIRDRLF